MEQVIRFVMSVTEREMRNFPRLSPLFVALAAVIAVFFSWITDLQAGTEFTTPYTVQAPSEGAQYSESRFGHAPAALQVDTAFNNGYRAAMEASAEAAEMDQVAESGKPDFNRKPAGLEFGQKPKVAARSPVTAEVQEGPRVVEMEDLPPRKLDLARTPEALKKGVQEIALIASDLGYFPKTVFVSRDVPVRFYVTGASKATLCIMMDSFQVRKQIRSQRIEEVMFTPTVPGKYRFYCPVNGMEGTLVVKELASS